jgi:hypothetical protein
MRLERKQVDMKGPSLRDVSWAFAPTPAVPWARPQVANDPQSQAANDLRPASPSPPFPPGTTAIIRRPGRNVATSGKARNGAWTLTFQPCSAQFIEPLMGWCGGDDPLQHVELRFPSREAAVRFAARHGIPYEVDEPPRDRRANVCPDAPAAVWTDWMLNQLEPIRGGGTRWSAAEVERAILDPARVFRDPLEVVSHPALTRTEKRRILESWEWDALRIEATQDEAWLDGEPSRLEEVRAALRALEARTMPPAPANTDARPVPSRPPAPSAVGM